MTGNIWEAKSQQSQQAADAADEKEKEEKPKEEQQQTEEEKPKEPEAPVVKKYVPPSLRTTDKEAPPKKVNKNKAPVLDSANFPTLG